jgi:glutamate/aspartate transport system substrate-binding protein
LAKIADTGTLTLGYRESSVPFSFLDASQKPVGLSLDLCQAVAEQVKAELKRPDLKVAHVAVNASNRIPLIQNGTIDLECGSTTNSAERQKQVAFSVATFVSQARWLTLGTAGIAGADALKGKAVVVTQGSLNRSVAERINKDKALGLVFIQTKDQAESLLMLRTGRVAAWFEDDILQAGLVANAPDPQAFAFLPDSRGDSTYYGLMLSRDDAGFKGLVDGTVARLMASGEFDRLYDRWFMQPIPPNGMSINLPMSAALKDRVSHPSDALTP